MGEKTALSSDAAGLKVSAALQNILKAIARVPERFWRLSDDYWSGLAVNAIEDIDAVVWELSHNICEKRLCKKWPRHIEFEVRSQLRRIIEKSKAFNQNLNDIPGMMECGRLCIMLWARASIPP